MRYVICRECMGYYRLEDDEYPEDFERCQCGGELDYTTNLGSYIKEALGEKR